MVERRLATRPGDTHREDTTMLDPMTRLRRLLSDRGIAYDAVSDIFTYP